MELTPKAQAVRLIKQSEKILILTHKDPDGDALGSSLALSAVLEKISKKTDIYLEGNIDQTFSFIEGFDKVKTKLTVGTDIVVTIDTRATGEDLKLGYKKFPDTHQVKIVVTPPKGSLAVEDFAIERSLPKYDLIIILDCPSLERIGSLSQELPELFFETPTVSIDHHSTNSYFAKVNLVDITAAATAEMLVSLIEALSQDGPLLDKDIATALLTGMITDTGSFQNVNTTPKSLTVAAQLVAAGADHQMVVERIRSKSLKTLRLWGKALSRVREEPESRFLWTYISKQDAAEAGLEPGSYNLIDELLKTVGEVDFALLLTEKDGYIDGNIRAVDKEFDCTMLAKVFDGGGHKGAAGFQTEGNLADLMDSIIGKVRDFQKQRLPTAKITTKT